MREDDRMRYSEGNLPASGREVPFSSTRDRGNDRKVPVLAYALGSLVNEG